MRLLPTSSGHGLHVEALVKILIQCVRNTKGVKQKKEKKTQIDLKERNYQKISPIMH